MNCLQRLAVWACSFYGDMHRVNDIVQARRLNTGTRL